jgi:hypothetical protein
LHGWLFAALASNLISAAKRALLLLACSLIFDKNALCVLENQIITFFSFVSRAAVQNRRAV